MFGDIYHRLNGVKYFDTFDETNKFIDRLTAEGYKARGPYTARGYVSRKSGGAWSFYSGRPGKGYAVVVPNWHSTLFCSITYYVKKEGVNNGIC